MGTSANEVVWCISGDDEYFLETNCKSQDEAVDEALRQYMVAAGGLDTDCFAANPVDPKEAIFFVGTKSIFTATVDAEAVIEQLQNDAVETLAEGIEDYFLAELSKGDVMMLQIFLQEAFEKWCKAAHQSHQFWYVENSIKLRVSVFEARMKKMKEAQKTDGTATERLCGSHAIKSMSEQREDTLKRWQSILEK